MKSIFRSFSEQLLKRLQKPLNFIQVVIGPRQVGKTTALKEIVRRWKHGSIMVSADEIAAPDAAWIEFHWNRAKSIGKNTLLVFDEIQKVSDWSRVIKYLFDRDRADRSLQVVLLGSASLQIQQGLTESLTGRYELIHAHHWSYVECRKAFGWDLETYLRFGGYPAASELIKDPKRWREFVRHSIIEPVLSKDILLMAKVAKPALFRQCFELAASYPAQEISLQKLLGQLQEKGNVSTVQHYLELFEGAYLIKTLQKFSGSVALSRQSSPKLIPLNTALTQAVHSAVDEKYDSEWMGRLLESAVGAQLLQMEGELYYWRDGKVEVDYVLKTHKKLYAIEVKSFRRDSSYQGLAQFAKRYPSATPIIIDFQNAKKFFTSLSLDMLA